MRVKAAMSVVLVWAIGMLASPAHAQFMKLSGGFSTNADFFGGENQFGGWVGAFDDDEPIFPPNYATAQFEIFFDPGLAPVAAEGMLSVHEIADAMIILTHSVDGRLERETIRMGDLGVSAAIEYSLYIATFRVTYNGGIFAVHLDGLNHEFDPFPGVLPANNLEYIAQPRVQLATDEGEFIDGAIHATNLGYRVDFVSELPPNDIQGCSVADIAAPFGVVNFDDVLAFLTTFGEGCE